MRSVHGSPRDLGGGVYPEPPDAFAYDIQGNVIKKCTSQVPRGIMAQTEGRYIALAVEDQIRDELISFGFIRRVFGTPGFKDVTLLPRTLIGLVTEYISSAFIHHIGCNKYHRGHVKISVRDIVRSFE